MRSVRLEVVDGSASRFWEAFRVRIVSAARAATGSLRLPDVRRRLADIDDALDQDWLFTVLSALRPGNPAP